MHHPGFRLYRATLLFHQTRSSFNLQPDPTRQRFSSVHHLDLRLHRATLLFHQTRFTPAYNQASPNSVSLLCTPPDSVSLSCTTQTLGFIGQRFFFTRRAPLLAYKQALPDSVFPPCTTQASDFIGQRIFFTRRASPPVYNQAAPDNVSFLCTH